jgi:hypothetical protein
MVTSGSSHIVVFPMSQRPFVNMYNGQLNVGAVRYNPGSSLLEVYDGTSWQQYRDDSTVDLANETKVTLDWARQKMLEEQNLKQLMERHPGLKDAHEKFEIMRILVTEEERKNA